MPIRIATALAAALLAAACHPDATGLSAHGGGLTPTAGLPSGPPTGAAAGTAISAFLHPQTVRQIDPSDRAEIERAIVRAHNATPGQQVRWTNPQTGGHGVVRPSHAQRTPDGRLCLDMQQHIVSAGAEHHTVTSACRQPDGTWAREAAPW